jgi:hypothetical protein
LADTFVELVGNCGEIVVEKIGVTSSVIAAEVCPSIRWTTLTLALDEIASEAAVCRSAGAVMRGKVLSAPSDRAGEP